MHPPCRCRSNLRLASCLPSYYRQRLLTMSALLRLASSLACACVRACVQDTLEQREPTEGWSAPRCENLGRSMVEALLPVLSKLRAPFPFGNGGKVSVELSVSCS